MKRAILPVFCVTVIFYISLLLIPDKSIAIFSCVLFIGALAILLKELTSVIFVAYLAFVPLQFGKFFPIDLVSAEGLNFLLGRPFGISADITVTPRDVLVILTGFLLFYKASSDYRVLWPKDFLGVMLLLFPLAMCISAGIGSLIPKISFLHALSYLEPYVIYTYFRSVSSRAAVIFILPVLSASLLFEGTLTLAQYVKGAPFGFVVEPYPLYTPVDASTEGMSLLRLGGTFLHANILAHYIIFSLLVILPTLIASVSFRFVVFVLTGYMGFIALMLSQSRTAWFGFAIGIGLWIAVAKKAHTHVMFNPKMHRIGWAVLIVVFFAALILGLPRVLQSARTFESYGSGATRLLLLREAWQSIQNHPWFGVGLGMDVYALYLRSRVSGTPLVSYFPEPVHNGFLQLLMQTGITGFVPYILIMVGLWRLLRGKVIHADQGKKLYIIGVTAAFVASVVNAQLQPLLPDLTTLVLLVALLT